MAFDKVVDSIKLNSWLTDIGDSVRRKTGKKEKIPIQNIATEIDSITGGGDNPLKYITSFNNAFKAVSFPSNYELEVENSIAVNYINAFNNAKGIAKVKFVGNNDSKLLDFTNAFIGASTIKTVDFTQFKAIFQNTNKMTLWSGVTEILGEIDLSQCVDATGFFNAGVREVRFKENTLSVGGISLNAALSEDSVHSIVKSLTNVAEPQTITMYAAQKNWLSEEEKQSITAKNWTLA